MKTFKVAYCRFRFYLFGNTNQRLMLLGYTYIFLMMINIPLLIFIPSYKNWMSTEIFSFYVNDGWCGVGQGIGAHCFGDFYYTLRFTEIESPWAGDPMPYPPASLMFFRIFKIILTHQMFSHLALFFYMLLSFASIFFPIYHLHAKGFINLRNSFIFAALTLCSVPVLVGIDRGNFQTFLIPLIYLSCYYWLTNKDFQLIITIAALTALKPQYILISVLFVSKKNIRLFLYSILFSTLVLLSTFVLYPRGIYYNIINYLQQLKSFENYSLLGQLFPTNLSVSSTFALICRGLNIYTENSEGIRIYPSLPREIIIFISILIVTSLYFFGKKISSIKILFIVLSLPVLLPSTSFSYHLISLIPLFIIMFADLLNSYSKRHFISFQSEKIVLENSSWIIMFILTMFLFIPWPIPWKIFPRYEMMPDGQIAISWTVIQCLLLLLLVKFISDLFKSEVIK